MHNMCLARQKTGEEKILKKSNFLANGVFLCHSDEALDKNRVKIFRNLSVVAFIQNIP